MANFAIICKFAPIILALAIILGMSCIEGRNLKSVTHQEIEASKGKFHLTNPCGNPGIGHSCGECKEDLKPTTLGGDRTGIEHSVSGINNDVFEQTYPVGAFRPTTPGHSPGIGHPPVVGILKDTIELMKSHSPDDFRRTSQCHKVGIGHSTIVETEKDTIESKKKHSPNAFCLTTSSHSPSVGRSTIVEMQKDTIESRKKYSPDDFHPTPLGHSPRIGHSTMGEIQKDAIKLNKKHN